MKSFGIPVGILMCWAAMRVRSWLRSLVDREARGFTRITNAFSRKIENHAAAMALHFRFYNAPARTRA
jgi:hypothetical protein